MCHSHLNVNYLLFGSINVVKYSKQMHSIISYVLILNQFIFSD